MVAFADIESKAPELEDTTQELQDEETSCQPMPLQLNQNITVPMNKKKRNRKSTKARGPVALPKGRGTGFEGRFPAGHSIRRRTDFNRILCRSANDP